MLIDQFIQHITKYKRFSDHTAVAYQADLEQFTNFIQNQFSIDLIEVRYEHITSWSSSLLEKENLQINSINRKLSTLRSFYKYLQQKEIVQINPMSKVKLLKTSKALPKYLTVGQLENLFKSEALIGLCFKSQRDYILLALLYLSGLRRSEVINILVSDIDRSGHTINILGKGNKIRNAPIANSFLRDIEAYIKMKNEKFGPENSFLLLDDKGHKFTANQVYYKVKKYLSKVSTARNLSPHILRHSFATHLTNAGADINAVKELLGHSSLAATQIYTHASIETLKEIYKQAHPKGGG